MRWSTWATGRSKPSSAQGCYWDIGAPPPVLPGRFDLDGNRIDADHFLQVLAVLGVAFETDGIAFDQELENHVLDEGADSDPVATKFPAQSSFVTVFLVP